MKRNKKPCNLEILESVTGQSLIEVIIGLAIGALLIGSAAFAIASLLRSNLTIQKGQSASAFIQELMDKVRAYSAADWQNIYGLTKGTSTQYFLNASGSTFIAIQGKEGMIDNNITNGLVGHWRFDEATTTMGTTAYDATGNRNDGTLTASTMRVASPCQISNCLYFDATTQASLGSGTGYDTSSFSFSLWVRPVQFSTSHLGGDANENIFLGRENYTVSGFRAGVSGAAGTAGRVQFWTTQSGGTLTLTSGSSYISTTTGSFYNVVVTYSSLTSQGSMYVNGLLVGSSTGTYVSPAGRTLAIDGGVGGVWFLNAYIDDFRWYNRALSADEAKQLYNGNIYTRYFTVENVCRTNDSSSTVSSATPCAGSDVEDPATQKVTVTARWPEGTTLPRLGELSLTDYFTRWQNAAFYQSDWSGGAGFDGPVAAQTNNYSTSSNIGAPQWGYLYIKDIGIKAPTDGLVAYWPFDEGSGTSTVDASGGGNSGRLSSAAGWTTGQVGNAVNFDSVSMTAANAASLQITGSSTFVFLAKFRNPAGCSCSKSFFYKGAASSTPNEYRLRLDSGDLLGGYGLPSSEWGIFGTSYNGLSYIDWLSPQTNGLESNGASWHLVAVIKPASGSGNLYSDRANLEYSGGTSVTAASSNNGLHLDAFGLGSPMIIDEFRIYNRVLSGSEIKNIYDSIFNP